MSIELHEAAVMVAVFAICVLQTKRGNAVTGLAASAAVPALLLLGACYGHA